MRRLQEQRSNPCITARRAEGTIAPLEHTDTRQKCLIATGFAYDRRPEFLDLCLKRFRRCIANVRDVRRIGSAALDICYVAAGVLDCYYEVGVHAWDVAAGTLIVEEAGGVVSHVDGRLDYDMCQREVLVSNKLLHRKIIEMLNAQDSPTD